MTLEKRYVITDSQKKKCNTECKFVLFGKRQDKWIINIFFIHLKRGVFCLSIYYEYKAIDDGK